MIRTPAGPRKEIKRTQNGKKGRVVKMARIILLARPKKVAPPQLHSRLPQVAKPVKIAEIPKPSRTPSQSPKPGSRLQKKENVWERLAINGVPVPPKSPQSCEIAQAQIEQFKKRMQEYRVGDRETTPADTEEIEERAYKEVEPLQLLNIYGRKVESAHQIKRGSEDGSEMVAASSLEEYYLSGGKMIPPTVQDFIGQFKLQLAQNKSRIMFCCVEVAFLCKTELSYIATQTSTAVMCREMFASFTSLFQETIKCKHEDSHSARIYFVAGF